MAFHKTDAPPAAFMTDKELRRAIHKYGKRALSRLKTLERAYGKGGQLYGRKSYVLDKFGDFNTVVKGKSRKALELQYDRAMAILNARSSTVKGVKEIDKERYSSFKKSHPNIEQTGDKTKDNERKYQRAMSILGRIQAAERGTKYDSDEQVFMAYKLADQPDAYVDDVIDQIWAGDATSEDFFEGFNPADVEDYLPVYDDDPNDNEYE